MKQKPTLIEDAGQKIASLIITLMNSLKQDDRQLDIDAHSFEMRFPHCSSRTLHKPGECQYCDELPDWQALRQAWGIAFTGHSSDTETYYDYTTGKAENRLLIPCPSERDRTATDIHKWHGNQPYNVSNELKSVQTGPAGPQGVRGPAGPPGAVGATGATGATSLADSGHYHADGTIIDWTRPGLPQCQSMHGNQQCQWKFGHTGPHQECMEVWNHN